AHLARPWGGAGRGRGGVPGGGLRIRGPGRAACARRDPPPLRRHDQPAAAGDTGMGRGPGHPHSRGSDDRRASRHGDAPPWPPFGGTAGRVGTGPPGDVRRSGIRRRRPPGPGLALGARGGRALGRLAGEVPPEGFERDLDRAYRKVAGQVKIPGFRKGKVPKKIIDARVGREHVLEEFVKDSVPAYYVQALQEHDLAPIADPEIDLDRLEDGRPLRFTATVEVRPRLTLTPEQYRGLAV